MRSNRSCWRWERQAPRVVPSAFDEFCRDWHRLNMNATISSDWSVVAVTRCAETWPLQLQQGEQLDAHAKVLRQLREDQLKRETDLEKEKNMHVSILHSFKVLRHSMVFNTFNPDAVTRDNTGGR